jgi:hypothetical protein
MDTSILWSERVPGAATWSHILKRGTALRMIDIEGGANVGAYFLNADLFAERLNLPDSLKAQHTAMLTAGHVLMSDMGRILCSITEDSVGWHDLLSGCSNRAGVEKKYGKADYQDCRNARHQNAYDGMLIELAKYGLGVRDFQMMVNFFSKVSIAEDGAMIYHQGHSPAGAYVELRAEMNTLVILNTCQHPLEPGSIYAPKPIDLEIRKAVRPTDGNPCFTSCPENRRAHTLTERYFL